MSTIADLRLKSKLYFYAAHVTDVYDGDTITADLDLGLGLWQHGQRIRFWKINAPEVTGPTRTQGLAVRDYVRSLLLDRSVLVRTILDKRGVDSTEKFGRLLGEILLEDAQGEIMNLNQHLLDSGMVAPFGEDGSPIPVGAAAAPMPRGATPTTISCPYCGERRSVDPSTGLVALCPNCLDPAFSPLTGAG
ncbi:MAG TPA: hypothetical protein PKE45_18975 [Caldilineaceae bacterium]|nr:hypothetical protein [Caldilineaceae bacterium]